MSHPDKAETLSREAEHGTPSDLQHVNQELHAFSATHTADQYGALIKNMQKDNTQHLEQNGHLPKIEFYDADGKGVNNSVKASFSDGTTVTGEKPKPQGADSSSHVGQNGNEGAQQEPHPSTSGQFDSFIKAPYLNHAAGQFRPELNAPLKSDSSKGAGANTNSPRD